MADIKTVRMHVERIHTVEATLEVDFDEIREWLAESGGGTEEITGSVVKDFLESGDDSWESDMRVQSDPVTDTVLEAVSL